MSQILLFRQKIVSFYKRYEGVFMFCFKLVAGIFVFRFINSIGLYREEFAPLFEAPFDFPYIVLSALLFTALPPTLANGLIMIELLIQISLSLEVAVFVFLLLVCVLVFYARIQPKKSFLIFAIIMGFYFKIPYAIVMFSGLYLGISSIIPIVIGIVIYQFVPVFNELVHLSVTPEEIDIMVLPETFMEIYRNIFSSFSSPENFNWIFIGFSFAMVILTTHIISRLSLNYSKDIAILLGALVNIICGTVGILMDSLNGSFLELILFTFVSVTIIEIIRFFDVALDYKRAERVQFEDEENYYYVKVIPKIIVAEPEKPSPPPSRHTRTVKGKT